MRAMVIHRHGTLEELTWEPAWPDPAPGPGEVVVKVAVCTLNYHDLFTLRGMPGIKVPMPIVMGIDVAGEVAALGSGVSGWRLGQRVLIDPADRENIKLLGEVLDGGLAEYVKVPAAQLIALPEDVSFEAAAALPVAYGTAYRMMQARGAIRPGEKVLILGASGGVGTCCVQLAKLAGAHVIAAASTPEKLARLAALGADEGIDYAATDFSREAIRRHGKPRIFGASGGVDVVVNFTGGDTWVPSLKCIKRGGRLLTCGATAGHDPAEDIRYIWTFEISVVGSNGWDRSDLLALLELVRAGKLKPVVETRLPLRDARQGFRMLMERRAFGKIAILP
ncbi:MAG: SDR family NAD(P)-dependent oxidoreductase [Burkholderiales bacterium]|nr:SDR family NAD(P)-dependent oxidoreductase [Burkholderiales bacterium]